MVILAGLQMLYNKKAMPLHLGHSTKLSSILKIIQPKPCHIFMECFKPGLSPVSPGPWFDHRQSWDQWGYYV